MLFTMAASQAAKWSSFCAGVNDPLGGGPPDLVPGLLLLSRLSSRTAIKEGLDIVMASWFSPYGMRRTCH
ncbi:hypothetical protein [Cryobacterium tagatosivorans]|uniref:Uncharacterized protein n=1 Tax=Cryobacterium tagatosivorans TaxID=1259199 RepID=A0A4R8UB76_9MICO|nr:hypothetical protein [Cryobacterium tagatosivorans]TFB47581.1 hypothetical protein E3O23_14970 [Cryobacterium tagatosivorans]